jgi:enamine deaminase RidA (YjgF/YER057c/UK114 family)
MTDLRHAQPLLAATRKETTLNNAEHGFGERICINPEMLAPPTGAPDTPFYSWVVKRGNFIFLAGMSPYSKDKKLVGVTMGEQARQAFRNMEVALASVGATMADVCSITIYVHENDLQRDVYPEINPACHEFFGDAPPARSVLGGVALPRPTERVMISGFAVVDGTHPSP